MRLEYKEMAEGTQTSRFFLMRRQVIILSFTFFSRASRRHYYFQPFESERAPLTAVLLSFLIQSFVRLFICIQFNFG